MSQAEKTLLRYQYVMANVSGILGDYQKTSLTWSNQIRMLGQNFERLGAAIGSGFIAWLRPSVVAINSYMDSIIASVQRTVNALGQIFGWQMIVDTTGSSLVDDAEGLADAYDDATSAAKKFKQQLLGIDELNNLTSKDGGSGEDGLLGGGLIGRNIIEPGGIRFVPYESEIKDLETLGKRFSEALRNLLPDDWSEIYEKAREFGTGISDFLNGLIQPDTFYKLGQSLAGVLNTIKTTIVSFFTEANWKQYKESIKSFFEGFFDEVEISTIGLIIGAVTIKKIGSVVFGVGALKAIQSGLAKAFSGGTLSSVIASIGASGAIAAAAVAFVATGLGITYAQNEEVRKGFAESSDELLNSFVPVLSFVSDTLLPDVINGFSGLLDIIKPLGDYLSGVFTSIWNDLINPTIKDVAINIIPKLSSSLQDLWTRILVPLAEILSGAISTSVKGLTDILTALWKKAIVPISQSIKDLFINEGGSVLEIVQLLIDGIGNLTEGIKILWDASIKPLIDNIASNVKPIFEDIFGFIGNTISGIIQIFDGLIDFVMGTFSGDWKRAWEGIGNVLFGVMNVLIGIVGSAVNLIIDALNTFLSGVNWATSGIAELTGIDLTIPKISRFEPQKLEMPKYYNEGGFPDQGSLFVAGETYGNTEWVGNINGRTGVVSGNEITGIAEAIYQTSSQEMELLRQQNQYLIGILNKEFGITQSQVGMAARSYAKEYYDRTGRQAYQY